MAVGGLPRGSFSSTGTFLRLLAASRKPPSSHGFLQQTPRYPFCPQVGTPSPPSCWLCSCPLSGSHLPEGDSLWVPFSLSWASTLSSPTPAMFQPHTCGQRCEGGDLVAGSPSPPTHLSLNHSASDPLLGFPQVGSVPPSRLLGKPTLVGWEPLLSPDDLRRGWQGPQERSQCSSG